MNRKSIISKAETTELMEHFKAEARKMVEDSAAEHRKVVLQQNAETILDLNATLQRVYAVHEKVSIPGDLGSLANWTWCRNCGSRWPCPTIEAIDGPDEGEEEWG